MIPGQVNVTMAATMPATPSTMSSGPAAPSCDRRGQHRRPIHEHVGAEDQHEGGDCDVGPHDRHDPEEQRRQSSQGDSSPVSDDEHDHEPNLPWSCAPSRCRFRPLIRPGALEQPPLGGGGQLVGPIPGRADLPALQFVEGRRPAVDDDNVTGVHGAEFVGAPT